MGVLVNRNEDNYVNPTEEKAKKIIFYIFMSVIVVICVILAYFINKKYKFIKLPKMKLSKMELPKMKLSKMELPKMKLPKIKS